MGRYTTKRKVFIVSFMLIVLFILAFVISQYVRPNLQSEKDITISYSGKTANRITTKDGYDVQSDYGKYFLIVNMTIENNGYDSFSTYPYSFHVIADNITYSVYFNLVDMENWVIGDVLNGGTFHGTLVFQLPEWASSFTLDYENYYTEYKIVWNKM